MIIKVPVNGKNCQFYGPTVTPVFWSEGPQTGVTAGGAPFSARALNSRGERMQAKRFSHRSVFFFFIYAARILHELYLAFFSLKL